MLFLGVCPGFFFFEPHKFDSGLARRRNKPLAFNRITV
jgi:hypothetical protein